MKKKLSKKSIQPSVKKERDDSTTEFPNIHRFFPEVNHIVRRNVRPYLIFCFLSGFLLMLAIVVIWDIERNRSDLEEARMKYEQLVREKTYWEEVIEKHKEYRDGFYKLAILEYQLGNTDDAKHYLNRTIEIDPQFDKGRELLEKLL